MSDRLREALDYLIRPDMPPLSPDQRAEIANHLRRFLALTETGPDYEAAEVVLERQLADEDNFYIDSATKVVVDAALADYLTEEE